MKQQQQKKTTLFMWLDQSPIFFSMEKHHDKFYPHTDREKNGNKPWLFATVEDVWLHARAISQKHRVVGACCEVPNAATLHELETHTTHP